MDEKTTGLDAGQILNFEFKFIKHNIKEFMTFFLVAAGSMALFALIGFSFVSFAVFIIVNFILVCFLVTLYKANLEKAEYSFDAAFDLAQKKWKDYFLVVVISAPIIIIGFVLLILPGVYAATCLALSIWLVFFNDMTAWDSIKRSFKLVNKKLLSVLIIFLIATVAFGIVTFLINSILGFAVGFFSMASGIALKNFDNFFNALKLIVTCLSVTLSLYLWFILLFTICRKIWS